MSYCLTRVVIWSCTFDYDDWLCKSQFKRDLLYPNKLVSAPEAGKELCLDFLPKPVVLGKAVCAVIALRAAKTNACSEKTLKHARFLQRQGLIRRSSSTGLEFRYHPTLSTSSCRG